VRQGRASQRRHLRRRVGCVGGPIKEYKADRAGRPPGGEAALPDVQHAVEFRWRAHVCRQRRRSLRIGKRRGQRIGISGIARRPSVSFRHVDRGSKGAAPSWPDRSSVQRQRRASIIDPRWVASGPRPTQPLDTGKSSPDEGSETTQVRCCVVPMSSGIGGCDPIGRFTHLVPAGGTDAPAGAGRFAHASNPACHLLENSLAQKMVCGQRLSSRHRDIPSPSHHS